MLWIFSLPPTLHPLLTCLLASPPTLALACPRQASLSCWSLMMQPHTWLFIPVSPAGETPGVGQSRAGLAILHLVSETPRLAASPPLRHAAYAAVPLLSLECPRAWSQWPRSRQSPSSCTHFSSESPLFPGPSTLLHLLQLIDSTPERHFQSSTSLYIPILWRQFF